MKKFMVAFTVLVVITAGVLVFLFMQKANAVRDMEIGDVDLGRVADGLYKGKEEYLGFTCYAEVSVRDHRITDVNLYEGRDSEWVEKAKAVGNKVMEKQSLQVDAVSGATITSKAMLKAIEKALTAKKE